MQQMWQANIEPLNQTQPEYPAQMLASLDSEFLKDDLNFTR